MSDLNFFNNAELCIFNLVGGICFKKNCLVEILTIMGNVVVLPYYLFYFEETLWNPIVWVGIYTSIIWLCLSYLPRK